MSRFYNLGVEFKKIKLVDVKKVVCEDFGWTEINSKDYNKEWIGYLICEGFLCGGISEEEAHELISKALKKINSSCKIKTRFTYMEDLPYNEYGDNLETDDAEGFLKENKQEVVLK